MVKPDKNNGQLCYKKGLWFGITDPGYCLKEVKLEWKLKQQGINVTVLTETKRKLRGIKDVNHYKVVYSGVSQIWRVTSGLFYTSQIEEENRSII